MPADPASNTKWGFLDIVSEKAPNLFRKGDRISNGYIVLSDGYTIKGSKNEQVLLNLIDGARYDLEPEQFDFLSLCDGSFRLAEILTQYDEESQAVIHDFINNLKEIGAICFVDKKTCRKLHGNLVSIPRLQAVHLEATSRCNMRCAHCYQGELYPVSDNLTLEEIRRLIEEMEKMQVENISISGGEPFLDKNTFDIVRCVEEHDIRVLSFFTNGLLVGEKAIERILACRSKPTMFVSLDAITPAGMRFRGFDGATGKKVLDRILENIRNLVANKIRVVINTVMNRCNITTLRKMYNIIRGLNVNSWRIGFPKRTGFFKGQNEFELPWETMINSSFNLLKHHLGEGRPFHLQMEYLYREELFENFELLPDDAFVCDYEGRRESCCVKPNGDVVHCAYCADFPLGNIRQERLEKIWYSSAMRKVKEIRIKDVEGCKNCELRPYCATGCRINAYFLHGDFYHAKDDYACKAVKFFVHEVIPLLKKEKIIK